MGLFHQICSMKAVICNMTCWFWPTSRIKTTTRHIATRVWACERPVRARSQVQLDDGKFHHRRRGRVCHTKYFISDVWEGEYHSRVGVMWPDMNDIRYRAVNSKSVNLFCSSPLNDCWKRRLFVFSRLERGVFMWQYFLWLRALPLQHLLAHAFAVFAKRNAVLVFVTYSQNRPVVSKQWRKSWKN